MESNKVRTVNIFGLGFVGLTLAVALASRQIKVIGVDVQPKIIESLRQGKPHFHDEGLAEALIASLDSGFLEFKAPDQLSKSSSPQIHLIAVGTPLTNEGMVPDLSFINDVLSLLRNYIQPEDILILRSTVPIGTTRQILNRVSSLGLTQHVSYCPERTAEGQALKELYSIPQIVSGSTEYAMHVTEELFRKLNPNTLRARNLETAEICKLASNVLRDTFFAFSNELQMNCAKFEIDFNEVSFLTKFDYPRMGLAAPGPVGGPCLSKDTFLLNFENTFSKLGRLGREVNKEYEDFILADIAQFLNGYKSNSADSAIPNVGILGLTFKGVPETSDMRNGIAERILRLLKDKDLGRPLVHDVNRELIDLDPTLAAFHELDDILENCNLIILTNNQPIYRTGEIRLKIESKFPSRFIYDVMKPSRIS